MKKKIYLSLIMSLLALCAANAQWRLGVEGGVSVNWHLQDFGYASTMENKVLAGGTAMISTQYNFTKWIGLRADLGWAQRNYSLQRTTEFKGTDGNSHPSVFRSDYSRHYLLFPVTASFSFGGEKVRGYVDLGAFVGGWLGGSMQDSEYYNGKLTDGSVNKYTYEFDNRRDVRVDAGLVGRIGIIFDVYDNLYMNIEMVDYWGMVNSHKTGSQYVKQNAYDNTMSFQIGIGYTFK